MSKPSIHDSGPQVKLPFPFLQLSKMQVAFSDIPNARDVISAIPAEFKKRNDWSEAASHIFFHGLSAKEMSALEIEAESQQQADAMVDYLHAWLMSYEPRHEDKEAIGGWLLSLMMQKPPKFGDRS